MRKSMAVWLAGILIVLMSVTGASADTYYRPVSLERYKAGLSFGIKVPVLNYVIDIFTMQPATRFRETFYFNTGLESSHMVLKALI